jgi:hypothetical protein
MMHHTANCIAVYHDYQCMHDTYSIPQVLYKHLQIFRVFLQQTDENIYAGVQTSQDQHSDKVVVKKKNILIK